MKIAVTSQDFRRITGHAGRARRFLVYQVEPGVAPSLVDQLDLPIEMAFHGFAGEHRPIDGVDVLVTGSAGDGLVAKMARRSIRVVLTPHEDPLAAIKEIMSGRPTPAVAGHDTHAHGHLHEHRHEHAHGHGHGHCGCNGHCHDGPH